jgi:ppGpp synthetase/RelA/SpoT-type nucleotidyltranferase
MDPRPTDEVIGYAEFGAWYDRYLGEVLEPALDAAWAELEAALTDVLSDRDLARIRSTGGRVKSKRRTWRKLRQPRFDGMVSTVDDIPVVLHDLVGVRVTCINVRDIEMVQSALESLPRQRAKPGVLWIDPASERDYVREPKESGYRGWHVNLGTTVDTVRGRVPVICELQVRSLLQDTWGELTHEDTYSKDGALPPLVEVLSKRMADLFSILDDIAEDLRTELDRIDEQAVAGAEAVESAPETAEDLTGQAADAAALLVDRWGTLDRPTDLATLAWALQREFGAEISDDWFGHGSFKRFLRHAVPESEISTGRQGYLLPQGYAPEEDVEEGAEAATADTAAPADEEPEAPPSTIPDQARQLRRVDRGFPLLESDHWPLLYGQLAGAWRRLGAGEPTNRFVNQLTRSARDRSEAAGARLSRRHLDYVAKAILSPDDTGEPLGADEIAQRFTTLTLQRMADLRILDPEHRRARGKVKRWLNGG